MEYIQGENKGKEGEGIQEKSRNVYDKRII